MEDHGKVAQLKTHQVYWLWELPLFTDQNWEAARSREAKVKCWWLQSAHCIATL